MIGKLKIRAQISARAKARVMGYIRICKTMNGARIRARLGLWARLGFV